MLLPVEASCCSISDSSTSRTAPAGVSWFFSVDSR